VRVTKPAAQWGNNMELDTRKRSSASRHFEDALRQKIVGQDEAVEAIVELYQVFCAGLRSPGRPVGNLLFLGPTGSGKARIGQDPHIGKTQVHRGDGVEPQSGGRGDARNSRA
jgi:hypothetical protein